MQPIYLYIFLTIFIHVSDALSENVDWTRSDQIKSGQHKLVLLTLTGPVTHTQDQPYQKSVTYNNIPKVALGMIIMDFDTTTNPLGYTITIENITKTQFDSKIVVDTGTIILELRYMYFTIDPSLNLIQIYQIPYSFSILNTNTQFNASETITQAFNSGSTFDITHDNLLVPFVKDFQITPKNNFYSLRVDRGIGVNSTHFTVTVFSNATVSRASIFVFWGDKTVVQAQQIYFLDFGSADGKNSQQTFINFVFPSSSFDYFMFNQGMNWINIEIGRQMQINFEDNPMTTTGTYNYIRKFMFHFRKRNCKTYTFYLQAEQRCYDSCPAGYANLTGANICVQCDYSCSSCLNDGTTCLTCPSSSFRTKSGATCPCNNGYFDNKVAICAICDYTCLTCQTMSTNCLSCDSTRTKTSSNACLCNTGLFDNGTSNPVCSTCDYTCATCSTTSTHCLTCSPTSNRLLTSSNQCRCKSGFSQTTVNQQQCTANAALTCSSTCETCENTISTCTSCFASQNRQLNGTKCVCINGYEVTSSSITCNEVCGNSILTTNEQCDDGNTQDGDGCSSACTIQSDFTCTLTVQPNYCKYNLNYTISYLSAQKDPSSNKVSLFFNVMPIAPIDSIPSLDGINNSSYSYLYTGNTLKLTIGYTQQIPPTFSTKLTLSNTGTSNSFNIVSSNKLRIIYYSDSYYNLYQGQIIMAYIIVALFWLVAIILTVVDYRNIGSVLQMLLIATMSFVGIMGTQKIVLLYYPLEKLFYFFTYNSIFQNGGCMLCVLNYGFIFLIVPLLAFLITLGVEKIFKMQGQLQNLKRFFLFDFPYAIVCLFSYLVCYGLAIQAADKNLTVLSIVSIPVGILYLILYIALTVLVIIKTDFFVNIKATYLRQIHFLIMNLIRQGALIFYIGLSQLFTLGSIIVLVACILTVSLIFFLKPYVNNVRAIVNETILFCIFICYLLISEVYVAEWSGFLILVLLLLLLLLNTIMISWDTYKRRKLESEIQQIQSEKQTQHKGQQNQPQWNIVENSNAINSSQKRYDTAIKYNSPQLQMKNIPRNAPKNNSSNIQKNNTNQQDIKRKLLNAPKNNSSNIQKNNANQQDIKRQLFSNSNKKHLL